MSVSIRQVAVETVLETSCTQDALKNVLIYTMRDLGVTIILLLKQ